MDKPELCTNCSELLNSYCCKFRCQLYSYLTQGIRKCDDCLEQGVDSE